MNDNLDIPIKITSNFDEAITPIAKALINLGRVAETQVNKINIMFKELNPSVRTASNSMKALATATKAMGDNKGLNTVSSSLKKLGEGAGKASTKIRAIKRDISDIGEGSKLGRLKGTFVTVEGKSVSLRKDINTLNIAIRKLGKGHNLSKLKGTLSSLGTKVKKITGNMNALSHSSKKSVTALQGLGNLNTKGSVQSLQDLNRETSRAGKALGTLSTKVKSLNAHSRKTKGAVSSMAKALTSSKGAAKGLSNDINRASVSVQRLSSNERLNSLERGLEAGGSAAITFKGKVDQLGFSLFKTQQALTIIASLSGIAFAISKAAKFGRAMAEVSTLISGTSKELEVYKDIVLSLSATYGQDTTEGAKALYQAISLGASNAEEATSLLSASMLTAKAGAASVEDSTKLLASTIQAYGLNMSAATDVADIFFTTVKDGGTDIGQLAESFAQVSPLAASVGVSLEELNAIIADTTVSGVKTPEAMTKIKGAITALLAPSDDLAKIFSKLGGAEKAIKSEGLVKAMKLVYDAAGGSSKRLIELLKTQEAVAQVMITMRNEGMGVAKVLEDMSNHSGNASKALAKMNAEPIAALDNAAFKVGASFTKFGDIIIHTVAPALVLFLEGVSSLISLLTTFPILIESLTFMLGGLAIVMAGKFSKAVGLAVVELLTLRKAMKGVATTNIVSTLLGSGEAVGVFSKGVKGLSFGLKGFIGVALRFAGVFGVILLAVQGLQSAIAYFGIDKAMSNYFDNLDRKARVAKESLNLITSTMDTFAKTNKDFFKDNAKAKAEFGLVKIWTQEHKDASKFYDFLDKHKSELEGYTKKRKKLAEDLKAINSTTTTDILAMTEALGVASVGVEEFSKGFKKIANAQIDTIFNSNTKSISTFFKEVQDGLSKTDSTVNASVNTALASLGSNTTMLVDKVMISIKRLTNLSKQGSENLKTILDEAKNIAAANLAGIASAVARLDSVYSQAETKLRGYISSTKSIAKEAADAKAKIDEVFLTDNQKATKLQTDEVNAISEVYKVKSKLLALTMKINAEDNPEKKKGLLQDQRALRDETLKVWETLKSKDPSFLDKFPLAALTMKKVLTDVTKFNEKTSLKLNSKNIADTVQTLNDVKESIGTLKELANDAIKVQVVLDRSNKDTFKKDLEDIVNSYNAAKQKLVPLAANAVANVNGSVDSKVSGLANDTLSAGSLDIPVNLSFGELGGKSRIENIREAMQTQIDTAAAIQAKVDLSTEVFVSYTSDKSSVVALKEELQTAIINTVSSSFGRAGIGKGFILNPQKPIARADGGMVSGEGTSTSDSIPAMLSDGEFVIKASAVKQYGRAFLDKLNTQQLPSRGLALGGMVASSLMPLGNPLRFSSGGAVTAQTRETIDLNLNIGRGTYSVQGEREQVKGLISALNSLQQGAA